MGPSKKVLIECARRYLQSGWAVVPIPPRAKAPALKGWQRSRLTEADLEAHFQDGDNLGLLLGEPSGGLVDADLDAPEAAKIADELLPDTAMISGRASKRHSHRWYVLDSIPKFEKFSDLDGRSIIEIRSTGQQTIAPPSIHPSGEEIVWENPEGEPSLIQDAEDFRDSVADLAAVVLLARHYPAEGQRHDAALALAGMLARGGRGEGDATKFVSLVVQLVGDVELADRERAVRDTYQKIAKGEPVKAIRQLAEIMGERIVKRLGQWLRFRPLPDSLPKTTDTGNAIRLVTRHGENLRLLAPRTWLVWDGCRWAEDATNKVGEWADETVASIYAEAYAEADPEQRAKLGKWALQSERHWAVEAMIGSARRRPEVQLRAEELDTDPWALNHPNRTHCLKQKED